MVEKGGYQIYPNVAGEFSFVTHYLETDEPEKYSLIDTARFDGVNRVPLIRHKNLLFGDPDIYAFPPLKTLQVYSATQMPLENIAGIPSGLSKVTTFDFCALMIYVKRKKQNVKRILQQYVDPEEIGQVVIVWDVPEPCPIQPADYGVPIEVIYSDHHTVNNRFVPFSRIDYDCVISITDGKQFRIVVSTVAQSRSPETVLLPYDELAYAIALWKASFYDRIVGFSHYGRNVILMNVSGQARTLYSPTPYANLTTSEHRPFASLVLADAIIIHRSYLEQYSSLALEGFRENLDNLPGCEDLLLNYIVANITGAGPVLITSGNESLLRLSDAELGRHSFAGYRNRCLERLDQIFGSKTLKYTSMHYDRTGYPAVGLPRRADYKDRYTIPAPYSCDPALFMSTEDCHLRLEDPALPADPLKAGSHDG